MSSTDGVVRASAALEGVSSTDGVVKVSAEILVA